MIGLTSELMTEIKDLDSKLNECKTELKEALESKKITISDSEKLSEMIKKIYDIKMGVLGSDKLPPWYEIIENVEDMWINGTSMSIKRVGVVSGIVDNKIYCITGYDDNSNYIDNNECYDITTNTWTTKKEIISKRDSLTSSTVDNKIYCIGGYYYKKDDGDTLNVNECYDTSSNTWTTKKPMITRRFGLTSSTIDNKIYCIGGFDNISLSSNECYDVSNDTWTTKKRMDSIKFGITSSTVDNKIYCIGGDNNTNCLNKNEYYDTNSDTWTTKKEMTTKRSGLISGVIDNKIYCIGGDNGNNTYLNKNECYDIINDTWTTKKPMTTERYRLTSITIDSKIYCIGGTNRNKLNVNEIYIP